MIHLRHSFFLLVAGVVVISASAQNISSVPARPATEAVDLMTPLPQFRSPVAYFRNLLAMSPKEREDFLTNRPPEARVRILAKINEYELLDPNERELRLRATELRWFLMPLLQTEPANREGKLAQVPDDLRPLVKDRLTQWDILPPPLKQEFLDNDRALDYFTHVQSPENAAVDSHRQKLSEQFNQFFELTADEKEKTLNTLSVAERAQMEKTLQSFDELPAPQRAECVQNYAKFASMNAADRAEFLQNAERWSQMSPAERQAWRDLVANVPQWPPLPQMASPPLPPSKISHPSMATN